MSDIVPKPPEIEVVPATAERWNDLEALFGPKGAYSGCWCMFWRLKHPDFHRMHRDDRKAVLKDMTLQNQVPGVLAFVDHQPVGWCSIGPRERYTALENSRILKRPDDTPVWSIVCFYVAKPYRQKGVMKALIHGAIRYAREQGAQVIEAFPIARVVTHQVELENDINPGSVNHNPFDKLLD